MSLKRGLIARPKAVVHGNTWDWPSEPAMGPGIGSLVGREASFEGKSFQTFVWAERGGVPAGFLLNQKARRAASKADKHADRPAST